MVDPSKNNRRNFTLGWGWRFSFRSENILDAALDGITWAVEKFVLILGPMLIFFASLIITGLSWTFFTILVPMIRQKHQDNPYQSLVLAGHMGIVFFLLVEICFNYFMCVTTKNVGPHYDRVVRELALATRFVYPETPQEVESFRRDYEDRMMIRIRRRQERATAQEQTKQQQKNQKEESLQQSQPLLATGSDSPIEKQSMITSTTSTTLDVPARTHPANHQVQGASPGPAGIKKRKPRKTPSAVAKTQPATQQVRSWMLMAHDEWGYCSRSQQPKPPRSHYDHVSKSLVLCLDHYCPWMFNAVGYFNYRYFCNFLWFVQIGMIYGAMITFEPFQNTSGPLYRYQVQEFKRTGEWKHIYPMVPIRSERTAISMAFMLCAAIGIAVACLGGFHLYLCLTGQTTIEFHGNFVNRRKAARLNKKWKNPYSLGFKRNFQQVYGCSLSAWKAVLIPSTREPEFLPLPVPGDGGKRSTYQDSSDSKKEAGIVGTSQLSYSDGTEIV